MESIHPYFSLFFYIGSGISPMIDVGKVGWQPKIKDMLRHLGTENLN
jgi:hypothetical protein